MDIINDPLYRCYYSLQLLQTTKINLMESRCHPYYFSAGPGSESLDPPEAPRSVKPADGSLAEKTKKEVTMVGLWVLTARSSRQPTGRY